MPAEYRAIWSVPGGGTGYSVFHFTSVANATEALACAAEFREFFVDLQALIPNEVTVGFDSEVIVMALDGTLEAVYPITAPSNVTGTGSAAWAGAVGARVDWQTGEIVSGRRFNGRTYLVPLIATIFDTDGTLTSSARTTIQNAADALISELGALETLQVWSRTHQVAEAVISATVPDKSAILRTRRDE